MIGVVLCTVRNFHFLLGKVKNEGVYGFNKFFGRLVWCLNVVQTKCFFQMVKCECVFFSKVSFKELLSCTGFATKRV